MATGWSSFVVRHASPARCSCQRDQERENPILTGLRYLRVFEDKSVSTYAQAAEILGTSRQRVYQMVSLVTRLPDETRDFLLRNEDPAVARFFTERRLRPIAGLDSAESRIAAFRQALCRVPVTDRRAVRAIDTQRQLRNDPPECGPKLLPSPPLTVIDSPEMVRFTKRMGFRTGRGAWRQASSLRATAAALRMSSSASGRGIVRP
jgi:hypothetical protein